MKKLSRSLITAITA